MKKLITPLSDIDIAGIRAGDEVRLSGIIYTARDQAHKRMVETLTRKKKLPFALRGQVIYYCGPTATPHGRIIGSCGPTTSSRMDAFTPALLKAGMVAAIGKGGRSEAVRQALKKYKGVYFLTYAGCGALLAQYVRKAQPVAYRDLGPEAIYKLTVRDFPLIVAIDAKGNALYD